MELIPEVHLQPCLQIRLHNANVSKILESVRIWHALNLAIALAL